MGEIKEMPDSQFCYEPHLFSDSKVCPDFDGDISMEPKCKKYGKDLSWTVSGRVLKCDECQGNN